MNRIFTLLVGLALPALTWAQAKDTPYASTFDPGDGWATYNLNGDDVEWTKVADAYFYTGSGFESGVRLGFSYTQAGNDWIVSPAIRLEAGKEYKLKFWHSAGSNNEKLTVYMGASGAPSDLILSTQLFDLDTSNTKQYYTKILTVEATGEYYFGFWGHSDANKFNQYLTGFQIRENVFMPGAPTSLAVTPGADRALTATLSWALPTVDADGAALPDGATYDAVKIYRDGEPVDTPSLAGDATSWTDDATTGLTPGKHTYGVAVTVNGATSAIATVQSAHIGPVAPQVLPYDADIPHMTQDDFQTFWTVAKGPESQTANKWYLYESSYYGNSISVDGNWSDKRDEWLISPELDFSAPGVYRLTMKASFSAYDFTLSALLGSGSTVDGYTELLGSWKSLSDDDLVVYIRIAEPCVKSVALHLEAAASYYAMSVSSFKVEAWHEAPVQITDLTATVDAGRTKVTLAWTNPALSNIGTALSRISKMEVMMDDAPLSPITTGLTPGAPMTHDVAPQTPGVHTFKVIPYLDAHAAEGTPMEVTCGWVGDETQQLPYTASFGASDPTFPLWTGADGNNDGVTFSDGVLAKPADETASVQHDDYWLSPLIDFSKPGYYRVAWMMRGGAGGYRLETGIVTDKADAACTFVKCGEPFALNGYSYSNEYAVVINVEAAGKYSVALHTVNTDNLLSGADGDITAVSFSISQLPVNPAKPLDLTAVEGADDTMTVALKWTNPTTSSVDGAVPVIAKAVIQRKAAEGGLAFAEVATVSENLVAGQESSWTDESLTLPGEYTYRVQLYGPDGHDDTAYADATTGWVGGGLPFPISFNMKGGDDEPAFAAGDWKIFNLNNDQTGGYWNEPITWQVYYNGTEIKISSNVAEADDWAISRFYDFGKGDRYQLNIKSYTYDDAPIAWQFWLGDRQDPADMSFKVADITTSASSAIPQTDSFILEVVDPSELEGDAFAAQADGDGVTTLRVPAGKHTLGLYSGAKGHISVAGLSVDVLARGARSITFDVESVELLPGQTQTVTATVLPEDAADKTLVWRSDHEDVATVDQAGIITAVAPGYANITAACGAVTASLTVTVSAIDAEAITLDRTEYWGTPGDTFTLVATVTPDDTTDKTVIWTSSDQAVATVTPGGLVSCIADGEAVITATCGTVSATCKIVIKTDGIALIPADARADARFYTLDGVEVKTENLTPGIYIARFTKADRPCAVKIRL